MSRLARSLFISALSVAIILGAEEPATAQDTCDVTAELDDPNATSFVVFGLDYSGAGGSIIGDSSQPTNGLLLTPRRLGSVQFR